MSDPSQLSAYEVVCSEVPSDPVLKEMKVDIWIQPVLSIQMVVLTLPPDNFGIPLEEWKRIVDELNAEYERESNAAD